MNTILQSLGNSIDTNFSGGTSNSSISRETYWKLADLAHTYPTCSDSLF